jgi:hypothetical protein
MPLDLLAERAGFEPALPFGKRALQARALGQTTLPLRIKTPGGFLPASVQHYTINLSALEVFKQVARCLWLRQARMFSSVNVNRGIPTAFETCAFQSVLCSRL